MITETNTVVALLLYLLIATTAVVLNPWVNVVASGIIAYMISYIYLYNICKKDTSLAMKYSAVAFSLPAAWTVVVAVLYMMSTSSPAGRIGDFLTNNKLGYGVNGIIGSFLLGVGFYFAEWAINAQCPS